MQSETFPVECCIRLQELMEQVTIRDKRIDGLNRNLTNLTNLHIKDQREAAELLSKIESLEAAKHAVVSPSRPAVSLPPAGSEGRERSESAPLGAEIRDTNRLDSFPGGVKAHDSLKLDLQVKLLSEQVKAQEESICRLKEENKLLSLEHQTVKAHHRKQSLKLSTAMEMNKTISEVVVPQSTLSAAEEGKLRLRIENLERDKLTLTLTLGDKDREFNERLFAMEKDKLEMRTMIRNMEGEKIKLLGQVKSLADHQHIRDATNEIPASTTTIEDVSIDQLLIEIDNLRHNNALMQAEYQKHINQVHDQMQGMQAMLVTAKSDRDNAYKAVKQYQDIIQTYTVETKKFHSRMKNSHDEREEESSRLNNVIEVKEKNVEELKTLNKQIRSERDSLTSQLSAVTIEFDKKKADDLRVIEECNSTITNLRDQMERMGYAYQNEINSLRSNLQRIAEERKAVESVEVDSEEGWNNVRSDLVTTIQKLIAAEDSMEEALTCTSCLDILQDPVSCVPCGHCLCRKCIESEASAMRCTACDPHKEVFALLPNSNLENLAVKHLYRKQNLFNLRRTSEKLKYQK